ncbi:MAG: 4'-phosphopantetheinyl transferase superfamily protein [Clostridia bacterium]|nr:4'-phosphopantetheinyl transferase superfamily protein [Clostridia bacterium]
MCENLNKTVLYAVSVSPLSTPSLFRAAYDSVPPHRRQKVDRCKNPRDKYLSLGAYLLLRYGLRNTGIDPLPSRLSYGEQGKPFFEDCGVRFNLSHSGDYAICALSPTDVGCDIEKIALCPMEIARRFFTEDEYREIKAQPEGEMRDGLFYRYWTLKESFIKATGQGFGLPLNSFKINLGENISVTQSFDRRVYSFEEFGDIPGYKCAVCTAGDRGVAAFRMAELSEIL